MKIINIKPIIFNDEKYSILKILDSAEKHFLCNSEKYYSYIFQSLDGNRWKSIETGKDGHYEYVTASATSVIRNTMADSDYRETAFRLYPEIETIVVFHGCSIKKNQYEVAKNKMELQKYNFEET